MAYDYSSESKLLELPNPYRLQNTLLGLCTVLLVGAGVLSLSWARDALQGEAARNAVAPLATGFAMLLAGIGCAATAARRLRFFFGRNRPASLAPEIAPGAHGGSDAAARVKEILRQGGLTYPEPQGAIEGLLYNWAPTLITAPLVVQALAQRTMFNLAAVAATLLSFGVSYWFFGNALTQPWISLLYLLFGVLFVLQPVLSDSRARLTSLSLVGLIVTAIIGPVVIGFAAGRLPALGDLSLAPQTTLMLVAAFVACALAMMAVLAQVDGSPQTRASVEQVRLSMNAPPAVLMDELDRTLQSAWTERIPNRRYARIEPVTQAATPSGSFAGELFEETQPLPMTGTKAPTFGAAFAERRHRGPLLLDLYATVLTLAAVACALLFVHRFDSLDGSAPVRYTLLGTSTILAFVAAFCFKSAAGLWGRFDFESVLVWVEVAGNYQTSRIGTGNNFSSRLNTENTVIRTEAMTLRVWRARIESVVFGKDGRRQVTAMFGTEPQAKALCAALVDFARGQSVLVAPTSGEDQARIAALNQGESSLLPAQDPSPALPAPGAPSGLPAPALLAVRRCSQCGTEAATQARFCSACAAPLGA